MYVLTRMKETYRGKYCCLSGVRSSGEYQSIASRLQFSLGKKDDDCNFRQEGQTGDRTLDALATPRIATSSDAIVSVCALNVGTTEAASGVASGLSSSSMAGVVGRESRSTVQ